MLASARYYCIMLVGVLAGCASSGTSASYNPTSASGLNPEFAANLAKQQILLGKDKPSALSGPYYLNSVDTLLKANLHRQATAILDLMPKEQLTLAQQTTSTFLRVRALAQSHKCQAGLQGLSSLNPKKLSQKELMSYYELEAQLLRCQGKLLSSVQSQIKAYEASNSSHFVQTALSQVWMELQSVVHPSERLQGRYPGLQSWFALSALAASPADIRSPFTQWQQRWPNHPGAAFLNSEATVRAAPQQVAVLLPAQGPYQAQAGLVRDGLMAAYYEQPNPPSLEFYDTSDANVVKQYLMAVDAGADVVIGPLTKDQVEILARAKPKNFPVPVLALNTSEKVAHHPNFYRLSLSPEEELYQLATRLRLEQFQNIGLLYPNNNYGQRLADKFSDFWGAAWKISSIAFDESNDPAVYVRQLLEIDASQDRAKHLRKLLIRKIQAQPRRRADLDALIIIGDDEVARQIRPLFDFYFADDLPVYALTEAFSELPNPKKDRDLNDIQYCDLPWILDKKHPQRMLYGSIEKAYDAQRIQDLRLMALGIDAYHLSLSLNRLEQFPSLGYPGTTGVLRLGADNRIHRQMLWAKMHQGTSQLIHQQ